MSNSAAAKLAALNAGLLKFVLQHSDFTDTRTAADLPVRPKEDFEWLQQALSSFETDVERIKKIIEVLVNKETTPGQLISSLEELEFLVEDLDNAQTLTKVNGVKPIVDLLQHSDSNVRAWAAQLISVCTHNLSTVQLAFLQQGVLARLLVLLRTETVETVRHKVIGAISSVTSNNPSGEAFFLQMNGLGLLSTFLASSTAAPTRTRIIFFLTRMALQNPQIIMKIKEHNYLEPIVSSLVDENAQLRETAAKALLWILNHKDNVAFAKELKLADILRVQSDDTASKLKEAEKDPEQSEDAARLREELSLLEQLKAKI